MIDLDWILGRRQKRLRNTDLEQHPLALFQVLTEPYFVLCVQAVSFEKLLAYFKFRFAYQGISPTSQ